MVVVLVNGEPVTRAELQRFLTDPVTRQQMQQELGDSKPESKELERLAVRRLIHRRLLLQEAGRRRLTVNEAEIDQALSALRRGFRELKDFGVWMKERGLDEKSLFEALRADMLLKRVTAALVKDLRVTEEQVQEYYEVHKENLIIGEEVRLRLIAVRSRAAAEDILVALRKGESFGRLALKRSAGLRAERGGDTGWVDSLRLSPLLQKAVAELKAGDVAGPLEKGSDEFLLVGLEGRRPVRAKSLAEARPGIELYLLSARQQEALQSWLAGQERNSRIEFFP